MQKRLNLSVSVALVLLAGSFLYFSRNIQVSVPAPESLPIVPTYPTVVPTEQPLFEEVSISSSALPRFHTLRDTRLDLTFNIPLDWKVQFLPEGDGRPSIVSPDFSDPLGSMTGAYLHYSYDGAPDRFKGNPSEYMVLLKQQELAWTDTTLDGHPAFISKSDNGYAMIISQFGDNWFVTVNFSDPSKKYSAVLDEFQRSFHAL